MCQVLCWAQGPQSLRKYIIPVLQGLAWNLTCFLEKERSAEVWQMLIVNVNIGEGV